MAPNTRISSFNPSIINLERSIKTRLLFQKQKDGSWGNVTMPDIAPYVRVGPFDKSLGRCSYCCYKVKEYAKGHDPWCPNIALVVPGCNHLLCTDCVPTPGEACPACEERGGKVSQIPPMRNIATERLANIQRRILDKTPYLRRLDHGEFSRQYSGKKRAFYENCESKLENGALSRQDAFTRNFTKTEGSAPKWKLVDGEWIDDTDPRNISPREGTFNVAVGRYIKPAEPLLLGALNKVMGHKIVMKGMNAAQVGQEIAAKWQRAGGNENAVAIGIDASRFDRSVSDIFLEFEHKFYTSLVPGGRERKQLAEWLSWQINNKGRARCADGTIKYKVRGTRCSGDMNTGLGNCLIASCMIIAYCEDRKVPFELVNNGDDCVVIINKKHLRKFQRGFQEYFTEMGFVMVTEEPVYELEKISFCQAQPVYDGVSYVMVRDPRTCISKDCFSLKPWGNSKEYESWIAAVGNSGSALAGGIPVLHSFYKSLVRAGRNAKPLSLKDPALIGGLYWSSKGMNRSKYAVSDEARFSFWRAFGITPDAQEILEKQYNDTTPFFSAVRHDPEVYPFHEHGLLR